MSADQDVREAAETLLLAITEAEAAGYVVQWPARPAGLATLLISATGRVVEPAIEVALVGSTETIKFRGAPRAAPADTIGD